MAEKLYQLEREECNIPFFSEEGMKDFLVQMNEEDEWISIPLRNISVSSTISTAREDVCAPEHIKDVLYKTGGMILNNYILSDFGLNTLSDRALNKSKILAKLSFEDKAKMLNMSWPYMNLSQEARCLLRGNRVHAVHSDGYVHLPQSELFEAFTEGLDKRFTKTYKEGSYSHAITLALYEIEARSGDIMATYKAAMKAAGFADTDYVPAIMFATADNGMVCASAYPILTGGRNIMLGSPLKIKHEANASVDDFEKKLDMCFALVEQGVSSLTEMLSIEIKYPIPALVRMLKQTSLPKRASNQVVEEYKKYPPTRVTAYELFHTVLQCMDSDYVKGYAPVKMLSIQESIARLLHTNWDEIDGPGAEAL